MRLRLMVLNPPLLIAVCSLLVVPSLTGADEVRVGKSLHGQSCVECHASLMKGDGHLIYTREDRIVTNFDSLVTQVDRCNVNLDVGWFPDEVEAVARYLDTEYYRF